MILKFLILFICCYFANITEVYHIQGCLKEQRTKKWWKTNTAKVMHFVTPASQSMGTTERKEIFTEQHSWIPCLVAHAFEWCFMSMAPLAVYGYFFGPNTETFWWWWVGVFIANTIIHYVIDIFKTHYEKITWCVDQGLHCAQIIVMVILLGRF